MIVEDAIKAFKKSPRNSFTIFLFHGVVKKFNNKNTVTNYNNKNIHLKKFKFFLKRISNIGDPISMDDVYKIIKKKQKISNRSFAITFDDGFENNIKIAAPLLINFKIIKGFHTKFTHYFSLLLLPKAFLFLALLGI